MRGHPAFLALVIACAGAPVFAQTAPAEVAPAATPASEASPQAEPAAMPASEPLSEAAPVAAPASELLSDKALGDESGQGVTNTVMSEQQLAATNSGNSVVASVMHTGDVAFSTSALTGFTGVGNFVINTGNNSNLQGTISVNIVTNAPPL